MRRLAVTLLVISLLAQAAVAEQPWMMSRGLDVEVRLIDLTTDGSKRLGGIPLPCSLPKPLSERTTEYVNGVALEHQTYSTQLLEITPESHQGLGSGFISLPTIETLEEFVSGQSTGGRWSSGTVQAATVRPQE